MDKTHDSDLNEINQDSFLDSSWDKLESNTEFWKKAHEDLNKDWATLDQIEEITRLQIIQSIKRSITPYLYKNSTYVKDICDFSYKRLNSFTLPELIQVFKNVEKEFNNLYKTSKDWFELNPDIHIIDPDGWDRTNFDYSWGVEIITKEEYNSRVLNSTIQINK